ncbi:hypothetical protein [Rhizobium leguminosarum]|uniref:hypothetical protein n=1 Tax=Rhizobium leguminosarum TaxID=384 RepID=UPI001C976961|nr:hypothetical protein [Rhizobium leguminosarum]MBY5439332.1 hypothetical protein [Rhizobium leguminosarum]
MIRRLAAGAVIWAAVVVPALGDELSLAQMATDAADTLSGCDRSPAEGEWRFFFDKDFGLHFFNKNIDIITETIVPMNGVSIEYDGYIKFSCEKPACITERFIGFGLQTSQKKNRYITSACDVEDNELASGLLLQISEQLRKGN